MTLTGTARFNDVVWSFAILVCADREEVGLVE